MKWKTQSGEVMDIRDMSDSHLENAIQFVQRDIDAFPGYQSYVGESEFAESAVEAENEYNADRLEMIGETLQALKEEQQSRKPLTNLNN